MKEIKGIRLQPIIDLHSEKTFGYEVLSELSPDVDNEIWFHQQSPDRLLALHQWQLQQLETLPLNGTLFLNLPLAALQLPGLEQQLAGENRQTVIELQDPEMLLTLSERQLSRLRQGLSALSLAGFAVWLDDYRPCYNAVLNQLDWRFDGIKIDKHVFQQRRHSQEALIRLIGDTRKYGGKILVEGVETAGDLFAVLQSPADMAQGFFWPEIRIPAAA
ncbi:EAL domain-containing protein [Entomohabitans teleogrylli]|uniref:EAL domain-containing protein n=1 Tax=Entomohabitans teleogrylli TaxID=1384589 RepID=UPI00073D6BD6|nr:EAL domain-containing protein [Entomohabitans teleogrylli]